MLGDYDISEKTARKMTSVKCYFQLQLYLLVFSVIAYGQEPPQRPYTPLEFETSGGIEIPIVWYETMYDSLSAAVVLCAYTMNSSQNAWKC